MKYMYNVISKMYSKSIKWCCLFQPMESNGLGVPFRPKSGKAATINLLPEVEIYLHLLTLIHLIDLKKFQQVRSFKSNWNGIYM